MNNKCCFSPADILIPKNIDTRWAVIACDQYTSEPEYWEDVKEITKGTVSTLDMILPECYLNTQSAERIKAINNNMDNALKDNIFNEYKDSFVYVERTQSDGRVRKGIIGKIDLECYDYMPGSTASIRATEKTVVSRIPARVEIRKNAPLEFPHVMLLIDDLENSVIGSATDNKSNFPCLYDFDLMKNAGSIKGYLVNDDIKSVISDSLCKLQKKNDGFLFCVGDGNHSLASAKECYNLNKNENSRYALVEIVNIHDTALDFEPIYRVVFGENKDKLINDFLKFCGGEYFGDDAQTFICIEKNGDKKISVKPLCKLPIGTLQSFLDSYLEDSESIDYIHGENSLRKICIEKNALGFLFEGMKKEELFDAVSIDGSLPRKTFSMGHADDKRFYLEAKKI